MLPTSDRILCAFAALGATHQRQRHHVCQLSSSTRTSPPPPTSRQYLPVPVWRGGVHRQSLSPLPTTTSLAGVSLKLNDNAGSLFPSDDSDYNEEDNHLLFHYVGVGEESSGTSTATVLESSMNPLTNNNIINHNGNDRKGALVEGELSQSPTIPTVAIDNPPPSFEYYYYDPIDFIADWCSDRFAEQSSSSVASKSSQSPPSSSTTTIPTMPRNNNQLVESYPPGSALDVLSRVSSSPYTPLSYQVRTIVRVGLPSLLCAMVATTTYPYLVNGLIHLDNNALYTDEVYTVLSNDLSQYVQNILTTSALLFGMLVGQTYFFMYLQQESVFYALFAEVTEAKSLLEQISLLAYGRPNLYVNLLSRMRDYIEKDLKLLSVRDPIAATSGLMPKDDPLESILYATSVGLPSSLYQTVKSLREARSARCGALQRKLPMLHIYCLRLLGCIVLCTFPVCGSGSVALAENVVVLQGYMFGVLAFGLTLILSVVEELRNSHSCSRSGAGREGEIVSDGSSGIVGGYENHRKKMGAYSVDGILGVMVSGLEMELHERLEGKFRGVGLSPSLPTRFHDNMEVEVEMEDQNGDIGTSTHGSKGEALGDEQGNDDISNESSQTGKRKRRRRLVVKEWIQRKIFQR